MNRKYASSACSFTVLVAIIFIGFALSGSLRFSYAQTGVMSTIGSDTTWTKANSPYSLTGPVTVGNGATLAIEPGVTVNLNDYNIQVSGTLVARGTSEQNVVFSSDTSGSANIAFSAVSASWNEQAGTGCLIENAILEAVSVSVNSASPKLNNNSISAPAKAIDGAAILIDGGSPTISENTITGDIENVNSAAPTIRSNSITGGIYGMGMLTSTPVITNNYVKGGSVHSYGVGIRADGSNVYIADNVVSNCSSGIVAYDGTSIIERNLVFNSTRGIVIQGMGDISPTIRNNTIANNTYGITVWQNAFSLTIINNNIENSYNYSFFMMNGAGKDVNATFNWWGTTDVLKIAQSIHDQNSDYIPSYDGGIPGNVSFVPFLTEPNPAALPNPDQISNPTPSPTASPTQISISVDTSSALVGSTVYVKGRLSDRNGTSLQGQSVVLLYAVGGSSFVSVGSGTTNTNGEYSIQWVNAGSGTFVLKAAWGGNADYQAATNTTTLSFLLYENQNVFFVESNSAVSALAFNSTSSELSFAVTGPTGTEGYVKVTIAKSLISDAQNIKVYLDGNQLAYAVVSNDNLWQLTFNYMHSTHEIRISTAANAATGVPSETDFWIWILVLVVIVAIGVVGFVAWRVKKRP